MTEKEEDQPIQVPTPGTRQQPPAVAHTGAGAGTALDAMLRNRQTRPRRDAGPPSDPPAAPAPLPAGVEGAGQAGE